MFPNETRFLEDAFGNALGNAAIAGIERENAHNATEPAQAAIEINPGSPQLQVSDINEPIAPIGPVAYTVQNGDSLSGILGTSDPAAIGAFMRTNGLTSSTIYPGEQLVLPSGGYTSGDEALGQATLNVDNQRIAALQASQSYDAYATGIQLVSPGEQEEAFNAFPSATYGSATKSVPGSSPSLAPIENWYTPRVGYFENALSYYANGVEDSNASIGQRAWSFVEAAVTSPLALVDSMISGVYNAPNDAYVGGQEIARGALLNGSNSTLAYLHGGQDFLSGFLGLGSVAALGDPVATGGNDSAAAASERAFDPERPYADHPELSQLSPEVQQYLAKYQDLYDTHYQQLWDQLASGDLKLPGNLNEQAELGNLTDKLVRTDLRMWLDNGGLSEGPGQAIQVNRNLYDPNLTGNYVRPDFYLRDEGVIVDGTIGAPKSINTTQMQGYINYADPNIIIEMGPNRPPRVIYAKPPGG